MQNLNTSDLVKICSEYVDTDSMSSIDYTLHTERVLAARAELRRRKTCTVVLVKITCPENCIALSAAGWTIAETHAFKRPGELTKFDKRFLKFWV